MRALCCGRLVLLGHQRPSLSSSPGGCCRRQLKSRGYAPNGMSSRATLRSSINAAHVRTCVAAGRRALRLHGHQGLLGEKAQKFAIDDHRKLKPKRNAEHQEEGEIRRPEKLPEQRRQNAKEGERTQHEGDDWLE